MMKATSPSSAPRIHWGLVGVFVFCFNLAAYFAANNDVALQTKFWVSANCGETVNLMCNATAPQPWNIDIKKFFWQFENKTCEYGQNPTDSEFWCGSTNTTFSRTITLTLRNVTPADEGKYLCKLHSTMGSWNNGSQLRIEGCVGKSETSKNDSYVKCSFEGVYPSGVVHWFWGNKNLTDVASVTETKDKQNRFNIRSTIKLREGHQREPYNCSLWSPSLGRYLVTLNSGCLIKLQWICVVVMVVVSLVM
ncbi:uncharacterized protein LOC106534095 [Austrofundulus limnaeus]|uniref:Uncharacterized protein LOC106534095 n=1 Tax=Austrofundulus limnaeus TaxID=52670 RepID=A0A2I4D1D0_AUSLI|nr:PREDICTED: uncharacterized protein LOC106534095 [Austrofundulus limnaeus]